MARLFGGQASNGPRAMYAAQANVAQYTNHTFCCFVRTPAADPVRGYIFADMISDTNAQHFIEFGDQGGTAQRFRVFTNHSGGSMQRSSVAPNLTVDTWYFYAMVRAGSNGLAASHSHKIRELGAVTPIVTLANGFSADAGGPIAATPIESALGNRGQGDRTPTIQVAYPLIYDTNLSDAQLEALSEGDFSTALANLVAGPDFTLLGNGNDPVVGGMGNVVFEGSPTPAATTDPAFAANDDRAGAISISLPTLGQSADATNAAPAPSPLTYNNQFEGSNLNIAGTVETGTFADPVVALAFFLQSGTTMINATLAEIGNLGGGRSSLTVEFDYTTSVRDLDVNQKVYWQNVGEGIDDWKVCDVCTVFGANRRLRGQITTSFGLVGNSIRVCSAPAVSPTQLNALVDDWLATRPFMNAAFNVPSGVLATLPAVTNPGTGYTTTTQRQRAFTIHDPAGVTIPGMPRPRRALIMCLQHSIEDLSKQALIGFARFAGFNVNPVAEAFRRNWQADVLLVNPQGHAVMNLNLGTGDPTDAQAEVNINRTWDEANPSKAVVNSKNFIAAQIAEFGPYDFFVDIHNRSLNQGDAYFETLGRDSTIDAFRPQFQTQFGSVVLHVDDGTDGGISTQFYWATEQLPGNTSEQNHWQNPDTQPVNDFQRWGECIARTLQAMLEAGDFGEFRVASGATTLPPITAQATAVNEFVVPDPDRLAAGITTLPPILQRATANNIAPRADVFVDPRGFDPAPSSKGAPNIARYVTDDTLATIELPGYFDGEFISSQLKTGDLLIVTAINGTRMYELQIGGEIVSLVRSVAFA